ncbi:hypothetical protein Tco_0857902 [Tanacetum coccineum]|uniref:Uncharacterized protein n=1 Tax=Tanacetum coccineum TaxID=301880 RepID=A0ABQ5B7J7_9ASTR
MIRGRPKKEKRRRSEEDPENEKKKKMEASEAEAEDEVEAEAAPIPHPVPANPVPANPVPANPQTKTNFRRTRSLHSPKQVWTGSSSSAAAGHNPEDLTPSHIKEGPELFTAEFPIWRRRITITCRVTKQEPPYALLETLLAPVTHNDPRDPYVAARDAATAPATDTDDSPTPKETTPSEPRGSPPRDS